jgi:hypothetical protein
VNIEGPDPSGANQEVFLMATEAQILANRCNAQKSTGPRTAEGKTAASQDAVKKGDPPRRQTTCPSYQLVNHELIIMQNKANFGKAKMKLNFYSTKDYENQPRLPARVKQTQSKPISKANQCCGEDTTRAVCVICFFIGPHSPLCYHSWQKKLSTVGRLRNEA